MPSPVERLNNSADREACIRWLAPEAIHHLILLGDLYPPLNDVAEVFLARDDGKLVGVGVLFRGFSLPAVGLSKSNPTVQRTLLEVIHRHIDGDWFAVYSPSAATVFAQFDTQTHCHLEQQMLLRGEPPAGRIEAARPVRPDQRDLLNQFYTDHEAAAWTPLMFDMGPYYAVWRGTQIVAAAGIHFVTPHIAQIGNVFTHPAFRGRGFGTATTGAVARHLQQTGTPIISLFVVTDNVPAIRMYAKLGFTKEQEWVFARFAPDDA